MTPIDIQVQLLLAQAQQHQAEAVCYAQAATAHAVECRTAHGATVEALFKKREQALAMARSCIDQLQMIHVQTEARAKSIPVGVPPAFKRPAAKRKHEDNLDAKDSKTQ